MINEWVREKLFGNSLGIQIIWWFLCILAFYEWAVSGGLNNHFSHWHGGYARIWVQLYMFFRELFLDTLYVYCVLLGLSIPTFTILRCAIFDRWSHYVLLCSILKHQLRDPTLNTTHNKAPRSNMQYRSCHQRQYQLYAMNITTFFATHQHEEIWALYQKQVWSYFETKYSYIFQSWERVCFRSVWHYQKQ